MTTQEKHAEKVDAHEDNLSKALETIDLRDQKMGGPGSGRRPTATTAKNRNAQKNKENQHDTSKTNIPGGVTVINGFQDMEQWIDPKHMTNSQEESTVNAEHSEDESMTYTSSPSTKESITNTESEESSVDSSVKMKEMKSESGTMYDYLELPESTKEQTKPPQPKQINKPETPPTHTPERTYKLHIKMRKQLNKSGQEINIVDHFKILLSRMIVEVPNLLLIPFDDNSQENHIIQGCDVPSEETKFTQYVKGARITKADSLLLNFKVLSPLPFGLMKNKPSLFKFLQEKKYFLQLQTLTTHDNIKVGGFIFVNNQYVRRDDISKEIKERMNEGHEVAIDIQLVPYVFSIGEGDTKIVTRTMAVETSLKDADATKQRLFKAFSALPLKWKYCNSSMFRFFPFRSSSEIPSSAIMEFAKAQNRFLHHIAEIPIYNIATFEWNLPGKSTTLRDLLMQSVHPVTKEKLCFSIERTGNSEKFFLIVKQKYQSYVKEWLMKISEGLNSLESFSWMETTGCSGSFRFTFNAYNDEYKNYTRALLLHLNPETKQSEETFNIITPPPPKKRNRNKTITYGKPPTPAWKNPNESIATVAKCPTRENQETSATSGQIGTMNNTPQPRQRNIQPKFDEKQANELDKRLLDRIKKLNDKVEGNIEKIRTKSNNTNFLVQQMLDNHEKLMEENRARDKRIDKIQQGMVTNNKELQLIRDEASSHVKKITKILTLLYNKISPEAQLSFEDWEFEDSATLDEILTMQGTVIRQEKKRKTHSSQEPTDTTQNMETTPIQTQPTPAPPGLRGVEEP